MNTGQRPCFRDGDTAFVDIERHPQKNDTVLASYCSIDAYNENGVTEGVVHKM